MRARAPGKLVLSGAYAVLRGAPAIVSAVSRYAVADSERPAELVTAEVEAALGAAGAPWFDASELRGERGKLGLGSSAAILVASLGAVELSRTGALDDDALARAVFPRALAAHRRAQGGGSGIDVAASAFGGTLVAKLEGGHLAVERVLLPAGLVIEAWAAGEPASTPALLGRVRALEASDPAGHDELTGELERAAEAGARAVRAGDPHAFLGALGAQHAGLAKLGTRAEAPIVTPEVAELHAQASREQAVVLPSGAGGGDVALFVGRRPPSPDLSSLRAKLGHERLGLDLDARGLHAVPEEKSR